MGLLTDMEGGTTSFPPQDEVLRCVLHPFLAGPVRRQWVGVGRHLGPLPRHSRPSRPFKVLCESFPPALFPCSVLCAAPTELVCARMLARVSARVCTHT